jgi:NRPS condensation-like uncharacterized protein
MPSERAKRFRATSQDLMNNISREIADQQLHFVVRCAERLDAERLEKAVGLCIVAQPILGCLLVEDGKEPHWRSEERAAGWGYSEMTGPDLESDLREFVLVPGDPKKDPLAQVRLFRGEMDTVCIRMDHVCADAAGIRNYGYLLADIYNALAKDPGFRPEADRRDRGMKSVLRRYGLAKRVGFARTAMKFMRKAKKSPGRSWQFPVVSSSREGRTMAVRHLTAERVKKTVDMAKRNGATLNDVLLAAYFRAMFRTIPVEGNGPVPLQVSADLRRYNPETADMIANLSSAIFAAIPPTGDEPFEQTLGKVRSVMDRMKASSPLVGAYAIGIPFKFMNYRRASAVMRQMTEGRAKKGVAMPLLSNFGKLDPERLSFDGLRPSDAYITTPVMFPPYLMLGVSGYEGGLTFTSGYCREGTGNGVEKLLDLVLAELPGNGDHS